MVADGGEQGLLSVAVAPDYATSGRVFIFYTDNGGDLQVDEFRRAPAGRSRTPVLTIQHDQADNHNGGQLLFGPDDALYLSTGDGGTQGDPEGDAQNLGSLLGKILRIDVGMLGRARRRPAGRRRTRRRRLSASACRGASACCACAAWWPMCAAARLHGGGGGTLRIGSAQAAAAARRRAARSPRRARG